MPYLKVHYDNHERDEAKAFLKSNKAARTESGSGSYKRWLTLDGNVWVEYDPPVPDGRYTLYCVTQSHSSHV